MDGEPCVRSQTASQEVIGNSPGLKGLVEAFHPGLKDVWISHLLPDDAESLVLFVGVRFSQLADVNTRLHQRLYQPFVVDAVASNDGVETLAVG